MTTATPRTTPRKKMNIYFTVEFRRCLDLLSASIGLRTCSSLIYNASVQFQMKIRKISRRRSRSPKYPELGHFTLLFCRGRRRNVQRIITHVHSYYSAHKTFVLWRSRCRCRRGLLKVPITIFLARSFNNKRLMCLIIKFTKHKESEKELIIPTSYSLGGYTAQVSDTLTSLKSRILTHSKPSKDSRQSFPCTYTMHAKVAKLMLNLNIQMNYPLTLSIST